MKVVTLAAIAAYVLYEPSGTGPFPENTWECQFTKFEVCRGDSCGSVSVPYMVVLRPQNFTYSHCKPIANPESITHRCTSTRASLWSEDSRTTFQANEFPGEYMLSHVYEDLSFAEISESDGLKTTGSGNCRDVITPPPIRLSK